VRIEKLRKKFNVSIKLIHFPLHPDTPKEGRSMADLMHPGVLIRTRCGGK